MKTFSATPNDISHDWHVVDAAGVPLGRLASVVAQLIRGKHKPTFTPHMDCGDNVIVINAAKVQLPGNKMTDRKFYWHTGHPGGVKERTMGQIIGGRFPERAIIKAVERMVPRGPLGRQQMSHLKVYGGASHPHEAQQPEPLDVAAMNRKNKRTVRA